VDYLWHQCLLGVKELKEKVFLSHLDLKLENIVIDDNYGLKLIDFAHVAICDTEINW
jgi:serine/threonine protein kinase